MKAITLVMLTALVAAPDLATAIDPDHHTREKLEDKTSAQPK
jgi:hypothetical protein